MKHQKLVCNGKQLGPAPNAVLLWNRKVISHVLMWLDGGEWRKLPITGLVLKVCSLAVVTTINQSKTHVTSA